jgi:hypothetical protein
MKMKYVGDSQDIVKRCLLSWLSPMGTWKAHPMLTEETDPKLTQEYARFLGVELLSTDVLVEKTDRSKYFAKARALQENLFLDPDTGVITPKADHRESPRYLFIRDLAKIADGRPERLTLVFDMSLPYGSEYAGLRDKLARLEQRGVHGFAYSSHTSFLFVSKDAKLLTEAYKLLRNNPGLPVIDPPNRRAGLMTI